MRKCLLVISLLLAFSSFVATRAFAEGFDVPDADTGAFSTEVEVLDNPALTEEVLGETPEQLAQEIQTNPNALQDIASKIDNSSAAALNSTDAGSGYNVSPDVSFSQDEQAAILEAVINTAAAKEVTAEVQTNAATLTAAEEANGTLSPEDAATVAGDMTQLQAQINDANLIEVDLNDDITAGSTTIQKVLDGQAKTDSIALVDGDKMSLLRRLQNSIAQGFDTLRAKMRSMVTQQRTIVANELNSITLNYDGMTVTYRLKPGSTEINYMQVSYDNMKVGGQAYAQEIHNPDITLNQAIEQMQATSGRIAYVDPETGDIIQNSFFQNKGPIELQGGKLTIEATKFQAGSLADNFFPKNTADLNDNTPGWDVGSSIYSQLFLPKTYDLSDITSLTYNVTADQQIRYSFSDAGTVKIQILDQGRVVQNGVENLTPAEVISTMKGYSGQLNFRGSDISAPETQYFTNDSTFVLSKDQSNVVVDTTANKGLPQATARYSSYLFKSGGGVDSESALNELIQNKPVASIVVDYPGGDYRTLTFDENGNQVANGTFTSSSGRVSNTNSLGKPIAGMSAGKALEIVLGDQSRALENNIYIYFKDGTAVKVDYIPIAKTAPVSGELGTGEIIVTPTKGLKSALRGSNPPSSGKGVRINTGANQVILPSDEDPSVELSADESRMIDAPAQQSQMPIAPNE